MFIEPAPTGRAICRVCYELIAKNSTRFSTYGYNPKHYHLECVNKRLSLFGYSITALIHPTLKLNK